jgi:putative ABC transport system permease protein
LILAADLRAAFRSLLRTPVRSFLVLQGIAWGVGIAIFPAAVLEGTRRAAVERADEVGTGRVTLEGEPGGAPLTPADFEHLRGGIEGFQKFAIAPLRVSRPRPAPGEATLLGTDPRGAEVRYQGVARGRYLEERDMAPGAPAVCVLEPGAAALVSPGADPLGRRVRLAEGIDAEVVGVLAPRSALALRTDDFGLEVGHAMENRVWRMLRSFGVPRPDDGWKRTDACVHLPLRLLPREGEALDAMIVRAVPSEAPALAEALRGALVARGTEAVAKANLVWPVIASSRIETFLRLKDALVLACLAMGGVVIANVMLLTLLERTAEIAVRRTEGATRADIAIQFLAEAGALGVGGAALGIPLAFLLAWVRLQFAPYTMFTAVVPWPTVGLAAAVGIGTAILAGVLPARRAALLDPAAALGEP